MNICTRLIELFPICDEWNHRWQRQISRPPQLTRVAGSGYREIVSWPFCLHYEAFWNGVGGVGRGVLGWALFLIIDRHDPVWKVLISVDLIKEFLFFFSFLSKGDRVDVYQEWGCCGEIDRGVFLLEWRWRDVMSLQGMWKHARTCTQKYAILAYRT